MLVTRDSAPPAADVRAALGRICASRPFHHSPRLAAFLRFVVETTLSGCGARLKGYTIAVEALGRGESFDPQLDPIVRVEATRLRHALARYYADEGTRDAVVIELPRGSYVPRFRFARRSGPLLIWLRARGALQRLLAAQGPWLLPPPRLIKLQSPDGRQDQQAESAPAARPRRPRAGRDRRDAADGRDHPRGL